MRVEVQITQVLPVMLQISRLIPAGRYARVVLPLVEER
jgi:hypothetical protein